MQVKWAEWTRSKFSHKKCKPQEQVNKPKTNVTSLVNTLGTNDLPFGKKAHNRRLNVVAMQPCVFSGALKSDQK